MWFFRVISGDPAQLEGISEAKVFAFVVFRELVCVEPEGQVDVLCDRDRIIIQ